MNDEHELAGGNLTPVVRVGDTVRRATGPWTPTVHALLRHLAGVAYPAPRVLGIDEKNREMLSLVEGATVYPDHRHLLDDAGLRRVGGLIAAYHEAQRSFVRPANATWQDAGRDPSGSEELIAHNDLAPWNLVAGPTWTFIDWDLCAPGRRHWDLAWALHSTAELWEGIGRTDEQTIERMSAFFDGAQVSPAERPRVLALVIERIEHNVKWMRDRAAEGDAAYVRLIADGHDTGWEAGARNVAVHLDRWAAML